MEDYRRRSRSSQIFSFCLSLALIAAIWVQPAHATFIFERTELVIHPVIVPPKPNEPRSAIPQPIIQPTSPLRLKAEIRPASSFQTPSLYLAQTLKANDAYLIPLPELQRVESGNHPAPQHQIRPANVYAPIDILAIDAEGTILQIWPNIMLSQLKAPITLPTQSHAVLYLAPQRSAQLGITPQDRVEHRIFSPSPESVM